jgi:hypothetical protein
MFAYIFTSVSSLSDESSMQISRLECKLCTAPVLSSLTRSSYRMEGYHVHTWSSLLSSEIVSQHFHPPRCYVLSNTLTISFHNTLKQTSQSDVTTEVQSVSVSSCRAPSCSITFRRLLSCTCGAPPLTRSRICRLALSLQYLIICQYVHKLKRIVRLNSSYLKLCWYPTGNRLRFHHQT